MNKKIFLIFTLTLLLFSILAVSTINAQPSLDSLQNGIEAGQQKIENAQNLADTLSDPNSRTEYLKTKWAEFLNDTPVGKAIQSTTKIIKVADPLFKVIFGAEFNWNLIFLMIFSFWLFIFAYTRKVLMPSISDKIKVYSPLYHGIIAFVVSSIFGATRILILTANFISIAVNKIPSLFLQIVILLFISITLIWYSIKMKYPYYAEHQKRKDAQLISEISKGLVEASKTKKEIDEIKKETDLEEDKKLSPKEKKLKDERIKNARKALEKIGKSLE